MKNNNRGESSICIAFAAIIAERKESTGLLHHAPESEDCSPALRPDCHISSFDPIGSRSAELRRSPLGFYVTLRLQLLTGLAAGLSCFLARPYRVSLGGATQKLTGLLRHAPPLKPIWRQAS